MQQNYLVIENEFSDCGVGAQFYGTSLNHIAARNKSIRTGGFLTRGLWYKHFQPSWYVQFLENEIVEGNIYRSGSDNAVFSGEAVIGAYGHQWGPNTAPLVLGAIIRGNKLDGNAHIEVAGISKKHPGVANVIIENNSIRSTDRAIIIDYGTQGVLLRRNKFIDVKQDIDNKSR
jgi:hypothetical protein